MCIIYQCDIQTGVSPGNRFRDGLGYLRKGGRPVLDDYQRPGNRRNTFVGQNYGAGRLDRVRRGTGVCMGIGVFLSVTVSAVICGGGHLLIDLFTTDATVRQISLRLVRTLVPTYITYIA